MKTKYYVLRVEDGTEPELHGPYKNEQSRDVAARRFRKNSDNDGIFWLNQTGQTLSTGPYSALFMSF